MPAKPGPLSPKRVRPLGLSALSASPPPGRGDSRVSPSDALAPHFRFKIASLGGINAKSEATSKTRKGSRASGGFGGLRNAPLCSLGDSKRPAIVAESQSFRPLRSIERQCWLGRRVIGSALSCFVSSALKKKENCCCVTAGYFLDKTDKRLAALRFGRAPSLVKVWLPWHLLSHMHKHKLTLGLRMWLLFFSKKKISFSNFQRAPRV